MLLCLLFIFAAGCSFDNQNGAEANTYIRTNKNESIDGEYMFDGLNREYTLFLPKNLPQNAPLVFVLHGLGGNKETIRQRADMDKIAEEYKFVICYPNGAFTKNDTRYWNAGLKYPAQNDDIGFLAEFAAYLQDEYKLDGEKTYSCGFSNGGFMSYTLGINRPDVFKAIACVAGTMSKKTWNDRDLAKELPVLHIHGNADNVVPIDGSISLQGGWGGAPSVPEIVEFWSDKNQCKAEQVFDIFDNADIIKYTQGINEVWVYIVDDWGHGWPNKEEAGFDASEVIWQFFSQAK